MNWLPYQLAEYYTFLETGMLWVGAIILVSSLDDLVIDLWYWALRLFVKGSAEHRYDDLTQEQLLAKREQHLAIMVPAWLEYNVIASMIESMVATLSYRNYSIFVGTYVNDQRTIDEVERMRRRYRQLHRVEVPHPGPTCKADCLNWIVQAIFRFEQTNGVQFSGAVLHDSEDVLHPLELRLFNYLLPDRDMIQLPVVALERNWFEWLAGTYMDEFAEWHGKDLAVRDSMTDSVPSAGVGTCFSRRALLALCAESQNNPFNTDSLTEDYDVGARLARAGMQASFVRFPVEFRVTRHSWFAPSRETVLRMPLCVREYFPDTFRTAFRQKARWTLGIGLQGWEQLGWAGSLADRYLLFRDRKSIVTSFIAILAYLLLVQVMALAVIHYSGFWNLSLPTPFEQESLVRALLLANAFMLVWRMVHRVYFTTRIYGWQHGVLSVPRMVVGNFVNAMAAARAWRLYLTSKLLNRRLAWDKTMHDFPTAGRAAGAPPRLESVLLSWRAISEEELEIALAELETRDLSLGRILINHGWLDDGTLAEAVAFQNDLPLVHDLAAQVHIDSTLDDEFKTRWRVVPLIEEVDGRPQVAVTEPLPDEGLKQVAEELGVEPLQCIAREREINAQLRLARMQDGQEMPREQAPLLGDALVDLGVVSRMALTQAIMKYRPGEHGRLGDYLVEMGVVKREDIERAVTRQLRFDGVEAGL
ncbi:glycosyl transferase family protein [Bordetella sp. N]|uniref:glycosyl transferase family protein n=1 Tax=Bordetella sp. N TaxID=1746199 RepID=UPI00070E57F7|nr:glycosyl transferase family protein [Bordetella sp. N]ALM86289.1 type II secretion system protein E [Bordetella sp. N]